MERLCQLRLLFKTRNRLFREKQVTLNNKPK